MATRLKISIEHHEKGILTDAWRYGVAAWDELLDAGFVDPHAIVLEYDLRAAIARIKGKIAGFIFWKKVEWNSSAFIQLSYVLPVYRRINVYSRLYRSVCEQAKKIGAVTIQSGIDLNNQKMRRAAEKMGRQPKWIIYEASL